MEIASGIKAGRTSEGGTAGHDEGLDFVRSAFLSYMCMIMSISERE